MPHARPGKEWLHLRDAICMGDTKAVVDVIVREGVDITYDEMDEMLIALKKGGTDACAVVTEQEFKFAINNMIAQATAVDPLTSFVTERWDRVFNDMVGRASGRIPSAPGAHEPGHQQTWQEALMDARRWAYANPQIADSGYAISYIDSLLDGTVERRAAEYAAMGIPGTDRASAIRTQMLYVLNNLASWRGEEARTAKATLRAVSKGDLPAHFTAAEEYVRRQTELQERDIHAATHHDHGEGQFDVYHPGADPSHYTNNERAAHNQSHHREMVQSRIKRAGTARQREIAQYAIDNPSLTHQQIADHFGINRVGVTQTLRAMGQVRTRRAVGAKGAEYAQYAEEHPELTIRQIAEHFGISVGTIRQSIRAVEVRQSFLTRYPHGGEPHHRREGKEPPSHYTSETPQGALEGMEERLVQDAQFRQRMTQQTLNSALAQMELRVGEIADAVRQMGTQAVPAPVLEQITIATEAIEEAAEQVSGQRGRKPNPKTLAIRELALILGERLANVDSTQIMDEIRVDFPDVTRPQILSALSASWRAANNLPNLRRADYTTSEPTPPPVIPVERMEGGELEDLLGGLARPQRQRRNGGSWSRKYYPGLTEAQHDVNDAWFEAMLEMLNPGGILGVPNIQKAFNKQGEEVPFPPQPGNPPNRVTEDPPN